MVFVVAVPLAEVWVSSVVLPLLMVHVMPLPRLSVAFSDSVTLEEPTVVFVAVLMTGAVSSGVAVV